MQVKFGPFCFDLKTSELTKFGVTLRLEEKPARLLACLLERQGQLVTREDLKQRLWDDGVHLDFDHGLNKAANKLRAILGDNAGEPKYVETLPRRGYRFIGQIETVLPGEGYQNSRAEIPGKAEAAPDLQLPIPAIPENPASPAARRLLFRSSKWALLGSAAVLLTAISLFAFRQLRVGGASLKSAPCAGNALESTGLDASAAVLPRNTEAAHFYAKGVARLEQWDGAGARALLDQSIAIEPEHALSHFALSRAYSALGFSRNAKAEAQKALDLSSGFPMEKKLLLEAQLRETSFDWDGATEIYRSLFTLSPGNPGYGLLLLRAEIQAGKPAMALETLRNLRQLPLSACTKAEVDLGEAEAAAAISDFHHQQEMSAKAAETARQSGQDLLAARAEMLEGEAQLALGNFREALSAWEEAKNRFAAVGDRSDIARILVDEGRLHWQQGDLPGAEQSYQEAIVASKEVGDQANLGRALSGLGQMKMYQVTWEQGRKICEQALAIFREIGNRQEEAYTLSLVADTMAWQHAKSKPLYERSLQLSREVNDRSRVAGRLMDLGIMAMVEGDLVTAERNIREALEIYHQIGERSREALQMSHLAMVFKWEGRLNDAEKLAQQAVEILQSVGETDVRGEVRQNLALIQLEAGEFPEAEQNIHLAMDEAREAGDRGYLELATQDLADILIVQGKVDESKSVLEGSDKIGKWTEPIGESQVLKMLIRARIYAAEGEFDPALQLARRACAQALRVDEGTMYFEARLVLGQIQLQSGNRGGRRELEELARDASFKGFGLIHDQARKALDEQTAARMRMKSFPGTNNPDTQ